MTVKAIFGGTAVLPVLGLLTGILILPAKADTLQFDKAPVTDVIAKLDSTFAVTIVLKGDISPQTPVTLDIDDTAASNAVLDAVNQLSNATNSDFQKSFVIRKIADSEQAPPVQINTKASAAFPDNDDYTVDVHDAIQQVAALDGATVEVTDPISETNVSLSDLDLPVADAANQIAQKTHTEWEAIYTLTPRSAVPTIEGKVVDRTNEGQPIIEEPFSWYEAPQKPEVVAATDTDGKPIVETDAQKAESARELAAQQAAAAALAPVTDPYNPGTTYYPGTGTTVYGSGPFPTTSTTGGTNNITVVGGNNGFVTGAYVPIGQ
jgi:hypothetical protein